MSQRQGQEHSHGGRGGQQHHRGGRGGHRGGRGGHHAASNAAESAAVDEARAAAQAVGGVHRHVVNLGLNEGIDDVRTRMPAEAPLQYPPLQSEATPAAEAEPSPSASAYKRPPVVPYALHSQPELEQGVLAGTHVIGRLQVAKWTAGAAFLKNPVFPFDIFVSGVDARGKGLAGDIVVARLKPQSEWKAANRPGADSTHVPQLSKSEGTSADAGHLEDGRKVERVLAHDESTRVASDHAERLTRLVGGNTNPDAFQWSPAVQPEAVVVGVLERRCEAVQCCRFFNPQPQHQHNAIGHEPVPPRIEPNRFYRFKSYRDDCPLVAVYGRDIPTRYHADVLSFLFLVEIGTHPEVKYADNGRFPVGRVVTSLGQSGTVDAESTAISYSNKIKDAEFTEEVEECVMKDFVIPDAAALKEMGRRDLREEEFVCTIDPATARDLDDALSITPTPGGYRVGVHIADVSFFVPIGTPLDEEAQLRATSTYYVERVIPMLPRKLCEDYCSLNAGVDKFAFSGIWNFDRKGNVQSEWFGQSVIRNRCRMAYEDAQRIIEGDESGESLVFVNEEAPREVLVQRVVESVKHLNTLALALRARRFERGALALNKGKLKFIFEDFNSKLAPKGLTQERQRAANYLVEEFMLHANCRVGEKVVQYLPDCALLRKHEPPVKKKLTTFIEAVAKFGITITGSSSKGLRESLEAYADHQDADSLRFMATLCMSLAKYTNSKADEQTSIRHFALAAPIYTHFTSPIRRYADLVIHRQLLLALDIEKALASRGPAADEAGHTSMVAVQGLPHSRYYLHPSDVDNIALHCNERKEAAKKAGEASSSLFLCLFIMALRNKAQLDPALPRQLVQRAVVVRLKEGTFTLYMNDLALTAELFHNSQNQRWVGANRVEEDETGFTVNWGPRPGSNEVLTEKMTLFSQVLVSLDAVMRGHMELQVTVHPPWERDPSRVTPLGFEL